MLLAAKICENRLLLDYTLLQFIDLYKSNISFLKKENNNKKKFNMSATENIGQNFTQNALKCYKSIYLSQQLLGGCTEEDNGYIAWTRTLVWIFHLRTWEKGHFLAMSTSFIFGK